MAIRPGLHDTLVTQALARLLDDPGLLVHEEPLSAESADELLARHIFQRMRAALQASRGDGDERLAHQLALTNRVLAVLAESDTTDDGDFATNRRLLEIVERRSQGFRTTRCERPSLPLRQSELIVNGPQDLRVGPEIRRELASADSVDVLVSFIKWNGFVELRDALQSFCDRHAGSPPLRILTTTYMGATEPEALEALAAMGARIRVSYDTRRTRLHAKAWLFGRQTGFSTALVGSSNLSPSALRDGCEWNVRLSTVDNPTILKKFEATFAQYWSEGSFEPYESQRFALAIKAPRNRDADDLARALTLHPYPHQQAVLDALQAERDAGHRKNLVVAATGTGKTVIAALDYRRQKGRPPLLFVAHREEILRRSLATFRAALGDASFGELLTGRDRPMRGQHVFASVQSLHAERLAALAPDYYRCVIVDEIHHAEASSWARLLDHVRPEILLGLTATPERADGRSILHWFDGRIAAESRLWDALDQELLSPFQYFGISDNTDLSQIDFRGGRYDAAALERIYTADEHRALQVLRGLRSRVRDPRRMRALGFCVSVRHAEFMAAFFARHGLPAATVTGTTPHEERLGAVTRLECGDITTLFTVDVFNEGVDLPFVDTVLFLRPTESATLFLQQLGRGLRLCEGKTCLTVLDFIGRANRRFRFDRRFQAMLGGGSRNEIEDAVEKGFPRLPSGCTIQLEEEARTAVLANIRLQLGRRGELAGLLDDDWPLAEFLARCDVRLDEVYAKERCFTELRATRGFVAQPSDLGRALHRLLHVDDHRRLMHWRQLLARPTPPTDATDSWVLMLCAALGMATQAVANLPEILGALWSEPALRDELQQLLALLDDRRRRPTIPIPRIPLEVHATYSRDEVMAGLGELRNGKLLRPQAGVHRCDAQRADVLFVTLQKDEKEFTPTTLYDDYPMSPTEFHWESQSTTRLASETGRRYQNPPDGWRILLFVRESRHDARGATRPYLFLGPVRCVRAEGERPIRIIWALEHPMPPAWFNTVKVAAA